MKTGLTNDYYEYEQGQSDIIVKGRLKNCIQFWIDIGAPSFIIETITSGYILPFYSNPISIGLPNNLSALNNSEFVCTAIQDLLIKNLIAECSTAPFVVNPLTVSVQSNGKKRLILDLREINKHLWKQSVKFEDMRTAKLYIKNNAFLFKYDIHSAYHHLDIFETHTKYLGFSWNFGGKTRYFKFLVLPFGLSSACYIFTKLTRPLVKKWRGEGKQIVMYLDDGLGVNSNETLCNDMAIQVKADLIQSGFVPKVEKSLWTPTKALIWLGTDIDTEKGIFQIPEKRLQKIILTISKIDNCLSKKNKVHVRKVASLVGQIISTSMVVGDIVYLMTKYLTIDINRALSWNSNIDLSDDSLDQIYFWRQNLHEVNIKYFNHDVSCQRIVYSDASNTGYGGYSVENPFSIAHGMWSDIEKTNSSTWKELTAVKKVFLSLLTQLSGKNLKWFTDNQNVVSIVSKGSTKTVLQALALDIFRICLKYNVNLEMVWIPRLENEKADYLSRIVDLDDWGISAYIFDLIESLWGPHEIDWFASDDNFKLTVFYSRFWNVYSTGMDAFRVDWRGVNGLFVPPVSLIPRVLVYMRQCKAFGTLILPYWPSASFWPILCPSGKQFITAVRDFIDLPTNKEAYISGKSNKAIFGNVDLTFRMLALRLDFSTG